MNYSEAFFDKYGPEFFLGHFIWHYLESDTSLKPKVASKLRELAFKNPTKAAEHYWLIKFFKSRKATKKAPYKATLTYLREKGTKFERARQAYWNVHCKNLVNQGARYIHKQYQEMVWQELLRRGYKPGHLMELKPGYWYFRYNHSMNIYHPIGYDSQGEGLKSGWGFPGFTGLIQIPLPTERIYKKNSKPHYKKL